VSYTCCFHTIWIEHSLLSATNHEEEAVAIAAGKEFALIKTTSGKVRNVHLFWLFKDRFLEKNSENAFIPQQWLYRKTNGTIIMCSSRPFQWMVRSVMSVCFDNYKYLGEFLCTALDDRLKSPSVLKELTCFRLTQWTLCLLLPEIYNHLFV
jgi:hypothetical protein